MRRWSFAAVAPAFDRRCTLNHARPAGGVSLTAAAQRGAEVEQCTGVCDRRRRGVEHGDGVSQQQPR